VNGEQPADDLLDLLSEVWDADRQANNPRTREFLDAGQELLHSGFAGDPGGTPGIRSGRFRAPFDELLDWVSRRRVVEEARRAWAAHGDGQGTPPTEAAYRYRWRTQTGYLRDLVVYALRPRMARPEETSMATDVLLGDDGPLDEKVDRVAYNEVLNLHGDKAFRLQMVFQATLAHDSHVANALRRIDQTNVDAWKAFYQEVLDKLGLTLRPDLDLDDLAYALQATGEGVVFRSLLPTGSDAPPSAHALDHQHQTSRPLSLIAMAILIAFTDPGDGKPLRQAVRELAGTT
jgi:hypothetical protein